MWYIEDNAGYRQGFTSESEAIAFGESVDAMWQAIRLYYA